MYMDTPRWWDQYVKLPWPDEVATLLKAGLVNPVQGEDCRQNERVRRTVVRYLVLSYVLCLRRISSRVRNQCPDMESLLGSCLIRKYEVRLSARSSIFSIICSRLLYLVMRNNVRLGDMAAQTGDFLALIYSFVDSVLAGGCPSSGASAL